MAHRGDEKGKGDRGQRGSKHQHNYILKRTVSHGKKRYLFYECINPGCPNPEKMEIEDR